MDIGKKCITLEHVLVCMVQCCCVPGEGACGCLIEAYCVGGLSVAGGWGNPSGRGPSSE